MRFLPSDDVQYAIGDAMVGRRGGVALPLFIAAAPAIVGKVPFARVECRTIKFIRPDLVPARLFRRGSSHIGTGAQQRGDEDARDHAATGSCALQ